MNHKRGREFFLFCILLMLLTFVSAQDSGYYSQNIILPNEQESFMIDISLLTESQLINFEDSLNHFKDEGDIISFEKKESKMIIEMNNQNSLKIIINNEGIFILRQSKKYIVEFKKPAILAKAKEEQEMGILSDKNSGYKEELKSEHSEALKDIEEKLTGKSEEKEELSNLGGIKAFIEFLRNLFGITGKAVSESSLDIEKEFYNVFNGVVLEMSKEDALRIKESEYVNNVYYDNEVHAYLFDSVPVIYGDRLWQLDENGNNCSQTGKKCINGEGIKIAIIDTGIDYTHTDLGGCFGPGCKVEGGYDIVNQDDNPMDDHGHGTHCAGIAAGDGVLKGVAPKAKLYAYKVLSSGGSGSMSGVIEGIERAVDPNQDGNFSDRAHVLSLSLGGSGNPDDAVSTAVDNAANAGLVVVVAAGNSGPSNKTVKSPGAARNALTVGATYKTNYTGTYWGDNNPKADQITSFSSRGPVVWSGGTLNKPDIVAPGALICSSRYDSIYPEGSHQYYKPCFDEDHLQLAGTSMATPHVAGGAALIIQARPQLTSSQIKSILMASSDDLKYAINIQGNGRMNLEKALNTSIILSTNMLDFGNIKADPVSKTFSIKNLGGTSKTIKLSVIQSYPGLVNLSEYSVTLPAKSEYIVTATIKAPAGIGGMFKGEIKASEGSNNYSISYSALRLSELKVKVEGSHFPNFIIYSIEHRKLEVAEQDWDFIGNGYSLKVLPGEYYLYAISDSVGYGETDRYILMDKVTISQDIDIEKIFRLSDAKAYTFETKSTQGEEIPLLYYFNNLVIYPKNTKINDSIIRFTNYGYKINQNKIYLSKVPDDKINADIIIKHLASKNYKNSEDVYSGDWILHNINDSTPLTFSFDNKNSSKYNFTFNLPGFGLKFYQYYLNFFDSTAGTSISLSSNAGVPSMQKIYAYVYNPNLGDYKKAFNMDVSADMDICYSLDKNTSAFSSTEVVSTGSGGYLDNSLKQEKDFNFGGPYFPGSVMTENGAIIIRNKLINIKGGTWIKSISGDKYNCCSSSCTGKAKISEVPYYQIYENGALIKNNNLTDYSGWNENTMNQSMAASKNYVVRFFVNSYLPIFNKTIVTAEFLSARTDKQPPWLTNLEILPRFKNGEKLNIIIDAEDDIAINSLTAHYENGSGWKPITFSTNGTHFTGTINTTGEKIDLKITIIDSSGNNQSYEIYPVSYKEKTVNVSITPISYEINPGDKISLYGYVKDNAGNGTNALLVKLFSNGRYIASTPSYRYSSSNDGYYNYQYTVPFDYSGNLNITAQTLAAGSFAASTSEKYQKVVYRYDHDIAIINLTMPDEESVSVGEIKSAKATIANIGNNVETIKMDFIEDYYGAKKVVSTKQITLSPGQYTEQNFSFTVTMGDLYYALVANLSNDSATDNNKILSYWYKQADFDASAYVYASGTTYYINNSKIYMRIDNEGNLGIENISYILEIAKDCNSETAICSYKNYDSGKIVSLKEGEYKTITSAAKILDEGRYMLKLNISSAIDQNPRNNYDYYSINVIRSKPDASVSFYDDYRKDYLIGIPNNITVKIYNSGPEISENITAYLYKYDYNEGTYEGRYTLLGTSHLISLSYSEIKYVNFLWTPQISGEQEFYINITSNEDSNQWNNYDWELLNVVKNETDLNISEIYLKEPYIINEYGYVHVYIANLGKTTGKVITSLYDNGVLVDNNTISSVPIAGHAYDYLYWTPKQSGEHNLKVIIETQGDTDMSNNVKEIKANVYGWTQATFKLKDSLGNPASRYIISKEYFKVPSSNMENYLVNGEKTFNVLDLSNSGEKLPIEIVESLDGYYTGNYEDMAQGAISHSMEIPFNKTMEIETDYFNNTLERKNSYHMVFANKNSLEQISGHISFIRNLTYLNSQGINSSSYLSYCADYNMINKSCDGYWNAVVDSYWDYDSYYNLGFFVGYPNSEKIDAFSITQKPDFDCGTTNLSQVYGTISNFTLERCSFGKIRFTEPVDISTFKSNPSYLAKHVKIERGILGLDTDYYPLYDYLSGKGAELTFKNRNMNNPIIYKDGYLCNNSICTNFNYNKNTKTVTLNVKGFSEYKVEEGPYCGDGDCQSDYGEECSVCTADCSCGGTSGGTSNNGGGAVGSGGCTPMWNCTWTPCSNNVQKYNCVDKKNCGSLIKRPSNHGKTQACTVNKECTDIDKDGYGIGKDCLGPDINDNDPGITDTITSGRIENPDTHSGSSQFLKDNWLYIVIAVLILIIVLVSAIIVIVLVNAFNKKEDKTQISISEKNKEQKIRKFE